MKKMSMMLTLALLAGCVKPVGAAPVAAPVAQPAGSTLAETGRDPAEFPAYVEQLKRRAIKQGIPAATVGAAFANAHFVDRVINADRNQLEKKITLDDYLSRVLPAWKIQRGREMRQQYQPRLARVTARYGVPEQYIVALWGMESAFGKIQGKEDVVSALATLAFEGRREAFFTKQLMAALKIIDQGHVDAGNLKGSWAGAMGQSQFMPTSFLTYAADGDDDGKIDIWNNLDDVFASTANYLATEGWQPGVGWGREVKLPAQFNAEQLGLKDSQGHREEQWAAKGVVLAEGSPLPVSGLRSWVIAPDDMQGRAFLVYDNFRTLMHWNRSYYFAISVGMMADGIGQ
ncbi:lytic murein transglycosylase [Serratia fonticola]|uniref:lytic murein transglycosylase n=1 Tax=Serratia fonticola TaxID=47917 RepID=UPI000BA227B4|nr:lytic murein transglycosylase [Serratia fonticola]PAA99425.1 lytic murein transglycosylase [Serratia fonticola]QXN61446.1 lytic murein transglycosylase [Serratia fonticola]